MRKKFKIKLIVMFVLLLFLLVIVGNFYLNKRDNIKRYFDIRVPSSCEFISYKDTGKFGEIQAVIKANKVDMKKVLESVKKHYYKAEDDARKGECYSEFEWANFRIDKEHVIEMYHSVVTRREIFRYKKSAHRYICFVKGDKEGYYIYFSTGK